VASTTRTSVTMPPSASWTSTNLPNSVGLCSLPVGETSEVPWAGGGGARERRGLREHSGESVAAS
jgi:hypothetical protein